MEAFCLQGLFPTHMEWSDLDNLGTHFYHVEFFVFFRCRGNILVWINGPLHPICFLSTGMLTLSPLHTPLLKEMPGHKITGISQRYCRFSSRPPNRVLQIIIASQASKISVRDIRVCHLTCFKNDYGLNEKSLKLYLWICISCSITSKWI